MYDFQRDKARSAASRLKALLSPILLQRKKTEFEDVLQLPEKLELVVWVSLSSKQRGLYRSYLEGRQLKRVLSQSAYPIEAVNYLKTLSRHPFLTEATVAVKEGRSLSASTSVSDLTSAMGSMGINGHSDCRHQVTIYACCYAMHLIIAVNVIMSASFFDVCSTTWILMQAYTLILMLAAVNQDPRCLLCFL